MFPIPKRYRTQPLLENLVWYTLCVSSRLYQTEEMPFLDAYSVWSPTSQTLIRTGDDCYLEYEPLYPGYIFVGLTPRQSPVTLEKQAKDHNHSFKLLRTTNPQKPYSMTASDLQAMVAAQGCHTGPTCPSTYQRGDCVKLTAGPLAGALGVVKRASKTGLVVSVTAFNKDLEFRIKRDTFIFVEPYAKI